MPRAWHAKWDNLSRLKHLTLYLIFCDDSFSIRTLHNHTASVIPAGLSPIYTPLQESQTRRRSLQRPQVLDCLPIVVPHYGNSVISLHSHIMFGDCRGPAWIRDDFTRCFQRESVSFLVIETLLLIYLAPVISRLSCHWWHRPCPLDILRSRVSGEPSK